MTPDRQSWSVRVTSAAETDFRDIVRWTTERFGAAQARSYAQTLSMTLAALTAGPTAIGVRTRDDIGKGLFSFHVASVGRKGLHFVVFRVSEEPDRLLIEVLRLLHDAMDLPRHLPQADERK